MRIREDYVQITQNHISSFYGVVHHDAKRMEETWKRIAPKSSLAEYFGTPIRKSAEDDS